MYCGFKKITAAAIAFLLLALAIPSFAGSPKLKPGKGPIDLSADSFSVESNGWVRADGNVIIRQDDIQVKANHVRVNKNTGDIVAEGDVSLVRKDQVTSHTQKLCFNYKTGTGLTDKFDVQSGVLRIIAKEAKRLPDGTFELRDALVTTCTNREDHLHYAAKGRKAIFAPERYVILSDMTCRFCDIPFFYFPWWKRSLSEHYGWRFEAGFESEWGAYLLSTYKSQLVDFGGEYKDSLDSATHFDYRTERGFSVGEDLLWHFGNEDTSDNYHVGNVGIYGIFDDKPMDEDWDRLLTRDIVEDNRYRITFRHDSFFTPYDYLTLRTSYLSDSYVLEDFYEDEYKDLVQPESFASYTHSGSGYSLGVGAYHRINDFYDSINRLPDIWFDVFRLPVFGSDLYYESQTSGGWLEHEYPEYDYPDEVVKDPYDTLRIDTRQAIFLPEKFFGWLNIIPRAVYRGTYYGDTLEPKEEIIDNGTNIVHRETFTEQGAKMRNLFELGAEVSYKLYGLYEDSKGNIYRHVVQPYFNYTYIPESNIHKEELYQFDSVDDLDEGHYFRAGIKQLVQEWTGNGAVSLVDVDPYIIYDIENDEGESELRNIVVDGKFRPSDSIRLELEAVYDNPESDFEYIDFWMTLWNEDRWEAAGAVYYIPDDCTLFTGAITYSLSEQWDLNIYARYDSERSRLEEISGYVQFNLDCISFRLRGAFEPSFTRDDGTEREAKYKIAAYAWLRAFAPERYERKLRDHYF